MGRKPVFEAGELPPTNLQPAIPKKLSEGFSPLESEKSLRGGGATKC